MVRLIAGLAAALAAWSAAADELRDLHLNPVPRSAAEAARIAEVTRPTKEFAAPELFEVNAAGAATVRPLAKSNAFSLTSGNTSFERELDFKVGNGLFKKLWVSAPSSTLASDGLGPLFNARSCQRCHHKDGRGHPPQGPEDSAVSMLVRLSVPADNPVAEAAGYLATRPEPTYGGQFHDLSIAGVPAEGRFTVRYTEAEVSLSEGETARLRTPVYGFADLAYGPMHPEVMISPRVAQQMIGLGLLEAIPAADILAHADPEDRDGGGISGRPQIVSSRETGTEMLGRFGHKAGRPSVREQSAAAFNGDLGISTTLFPEAAGDCTPAQMRCTAAPNGNTAGHDNAEAGDGVLELVTFYARNLGVPARRDAGDAEVLRGKQVFYETGCIACYTPKFVTHRLPDMPEQSFQVIWPYTDLLLHGMGPGLADNRPDGRASGQEWRTPPLWGIGLTQQVSGHSYFLHDGRARSLLEAVLWHGGEAEAQRTRVVEMPKADRDALIRFLESL